MDNIEPEREQEVSKPKTCKTCVFLFVALFIIFFIMSIYFACVIQPRLPRFVLDDIYVDEYISNSSAMVKLTTTNPSYVSTIHYSKINLHMWLEGNLETEKVFLDNKKQKPLETATWSSVIIINNDIEPIDGFNANGAVIAKFKIEWKRGIYRSSKIGLCVNCPVFVYFKDLSSLVFKPTSNCSTDIIFLKPCF